MNLTVNVMVEDLRAVRLYNLDLETIIWTDLRFGTVVWMDLGIASVGLWGLEEVIVMLNLEAE